MSMRQRHLWWNRISLISLVLAAPLLLFPEGWRFLALLVLPIIWIGNRIFTRHFVPRTPFDSVLLCLLVAVLISLFATYDLAVSGSKIAGLLFGISVYYAMVNFIEAPRQIRQVIIGVLLLIVVFSGLVLVGTNWGRKVPLLEQIGAQLPLLIRGLPGADSGFHPAEVGGTLTWIIFLPVTISIGLWTRHRSPGVMVLSLGLVVLSGVLGAALLLTQSRSAWLGVAAGVAVVLWLLGRWGRVILIGGLAIGLIAAVMLGPAFNPGLSDRSEIWSRAVYGIEDFSITGMGMGTFRFIMPVLYPLFAVSPDVDLGHAHNEWLQAGVDLGLLGLIAFLALQGLSVVLAFGAFRQPWPPEVRWLMAGVLAGFVAHGVYGLTDAVALGAKPGFFFWLLLALTASVWRVSATFWDNQWNRNVVKTQNVDIINKSLAFQANG